jgi:hypothetical protein
MVRDFDNYVLVCLLAPKSNAQTAKCPRLASFGAEAATTFPSEIISATAWFVKSRNAMVVCSSVYIAARNSASSAKILTIATSVRCHCVSNAKIRLPVPSARRHSATTAKTGNIAKGARRNSVVSVKTVSSAQSATSSPALNANMTPVRCATRNSAKAAKAAKISAAAPGATRHSALTAQSSTTAKGVGQNSDVSVNTVSTVSVNTVSTVSVKTVSTVKSVTQVVLYANVIEPVENVSIRQHIESIVASYLDDCIQAGRVRPRPRPRPWPSWPALSALKLNAGGADTGAPKTN